MLQRVKLESPLWGIALAFCLTAMVALLIKGPRATLAIALLYGVGVALTFDEIGMWWNPRIERGARWSYNGLAILIAAFALWCLLPFLLRRKTPIVRRA